MNCSVWIKVLSIMNIQQLRRSGDPKIVDETNLSDPSMSIALPCQQVKRLNALGLIMPFDNVSSLIHPALEELYNHGHISCTTDLVSDIISHLQKYLSDCCSTLPCLACYPGCAYNGKISSSCTMCLKPP